MLSPSHPHQKSSCPSERNDENLTAFTSLCFSGWRRISLNVKMVRWQRTLPEPVMWKSIPYNSKNLKTALDQKSGFATLIYALAFDFYLETTICHALHVKRHRHIFISFHQFTHFFHHLRIYFISVLLRFKNDK